MPPQPVGEWTPSLARVDLPSRLRSPQSAGHRTAVAFRPECGLTGRQQWDCFPWAPSQVNRCCDRLALIQAKVGRSAFFLRPGGPTPGPVAARSGPGELTAGVSPRSGQPQARHLQHIVGSHHKAGFVAGPGRAERDSPSTSAEKSQATSAKSTRSELLAKTTGVKPPWLSWRFRNQSQTRF